MAEKSRTEISSDTLQAVRELAETLGRSESDVLDEAVYYYFDALVLAYAWGRERRSAGLPDFYRRLRNELVHAPTKRPLRRDDLLALLDRMSSRFELDDEEAMRIAVEEQKAFRQERADRERDREWRT